MLGALASTIQGCAAANLLSQWKLFGEDFMAGEITEYPLIIPFHSLERYQFYIILYQWIGPGC